MSYYSCYLTIAVLCEFYSRSQLSRSTAILVKSLRIFQYNSCLNFVRIDFCSYTIYLRKEPIFGISREHWVSDMVILRENHIVLCHSEYKVEWYLDDCSMYLRIIRVGQMFNVSLTLLRVLGTVGWKSRKTNSVKLLGLDVVQYHWPTCKVRTLREPLPWSREICSIIHLF